MSEFSLGRYYDNIRRILTYEGKTTEMIYNYLAIGLILLSLQIKNPSYLYLLIVSFLLKIQIATCSFTKCTGVSLIWSGLLGIALVEFSYFPFNFVDIIAFPYALYMIYRYRNSTRSTLAHVIGIICGSIIMIIINKLWSKS